MKKNINGKIYDTKTASLLGTWINGYIQRDPRCVIEELYRKRAVFVDGKGWKAGAKIIPLNYENARMWAEEHLRGDDYQEIFGEVAEDDSRTAFSISLSASAAEIARRAAAAAETSLSAYIESLIWAAKSM